VPVLGTTDFWIVKIDSAGNMQWDKDYGGTAWEDDFGNISQVAGGDYLIGGTSYSDMSGTKSENNLGTEQTWILRIDSAGNVKWDKTVFSNGHDEKGLVIETRDGCYLVASMTSAGVGGEKSQPSRGANDYWIIKYCETLQAGFTSPIAVCPGSCIAFTNLSFNALSFQWFFPGASPDSSTAINPLNICYANPGNYDVQLIASNGNVSDTILISNYITVYPSPPIQSITQLGDTLFALTGANSYQWYFNGNNIPGATDYFYTASASGDYNVVATDSNGCEVEAVIFNVMASTPFTNSDLQISLYPNPVEEKLFVKGYPLSGSSLEISIFNIFGEKIIFSEDSQMPAIDCKTLIAGIYFIEINSGEKIFRCKFVKQ